VANLLSSKKRIKQNERNRLRNRARKAVIKTQTRRLLDAIHDGKLDDAQELYRGLSKRLDQTAAQGTLHRNTAARRKSRLARQINAARAAAS